MTITEKNEQENADVSIARRERSKRINRGDVN